MRMWGAQSARRARVRKGTLLSRALPWRLAPQAAPSAASQSPAADTMVRPASACALPCVSSCSLRAVQAPKKGEPTEPVTNVTLGPGAREGEHVFGVARILASFNDTFVCVPGAERTH